MYPFGRSYVHSTHVVHKEMRLRGDEKMRVNASVKDGNAWNDSHWLFLIETVMVKWRDQVCFWLGEFLLSEDDDRWDGMNGMEVIAL
jgi:hypothetical protein